MFPRLVLFCALAALAPAQELDPALVLQRLRKVTTYAESNLLRPEACPFDPAHVVAEVGEEADALAAWVRENIRWEPYRGSVRGVAGTLAAGAGSDWDRALLLGALLEEAGQRCQYRVLPRGGEERGALMRFLTMPEPEETALAGEDPVLTELGISAASQEAWNREARARWQGVLDEAIDAAAVELPALWATTAEQAAWDTFDWREHLAEAATERVFVELADGTIVDLGPEKAPHRDLLSTAERVAGPSAEQRARFSLAVEVVSDYETGPESTVIFTFDCAPEDVFGSGLRLQVIPSAGRIPAPPDQWKPEEWYPIVTGFDSFQVVLRAGRTSRASPVAFDRDGRVFGNGRGATGSELGMGMGGIDLAGPLMGEGNEGPQPTGLRAVVLRMELALPGADPQVFERLLCGALRPGVSPIFKTDIVLAPGPIGDATLSWLSMEGAVRAAQALPKLVGAKDPLALMRGADRLKPMPQLLYRWLTGRRELIARLCAEYPAVALRGGPAIALRSHWMLPDPETKEVGKRSAIDVVYDGLLCVPIGEAAAENAARANMHLGIGATVLESLLVREFGFHLYARGTHDAFEDDRAAGATHTCVTAAQAAGQALPPLARHALRQEGGRLLVYARDGVHWWSVDPRTGATIGRGDGGEGQGMTEYLDVHQAQVKNLVCFKAFAQGIIFGTADRDALIHDWIVCVAGFDDPTLVSDTWAALSENPAAGRYAGVLKIVFGLIGLWKQATEE